MFVIIVYIFEIKMDAETRLLFILVSGDYVLPSNTRTRLLMARLRLLLLRPQRLYRALYLSVDRVGVGSYILKIIVGFIL